MALDLDERQRAMLQEMRVPVWWPAVQPAAAESAEPVVRQLGTQPAETPARGGDRYPASARPGAGATPTASRVATAGTGTGAGNATAWVDADAAAPGSAGGLDWPTLAHTVAACQDCKLCVGRKAAVFQAEPQPRQADWLVVGEPPDEQEERAGAPFAGQAGELLDNMLRAVRVTREGTGRTGARLANVVRCRPAAVRNPQADELATCAQYLRREIALVRPRVILAMGRFAAQSLLGNQNPELAALPFGKLRGQVHRFEGVPVVVVSHPTRLLRAQEDKAGAWADLCLAQSVMAQPD